jgi:hypothetical protein
MYQATSPWYAMCDIVNIEICRANYTLDEFNYANA